MPAGKQIKIPRKKTIAMVCFGSLNLSEKKKKLKIINEGTIVIRSVVIIF